MNRYHITVQVDKRRNNRPIAKILNDKIRRDYQLYEILCVEMGI